VNALSASYDEVDNRVVLDVTSDPGIQAVSIWRGEPSEPVRPIPSLTGAPVAESGVTRLYDYAAPLNQTIIYRAVFYRGPQLIVDATTPITTAAVTTTVTKFWLKKPPGCTA
jgi:hypothetical protein